MPNFNSLDKFLDMGQVKRWHTVRGVSQTTAEHSWGVALFLTIYHPYPSARLLRAAILHDLHESEFADIPSHIKDKYSFLLDIEEAEEQLFFRKYGIENPYEDMSKEELKWLKLADMSEAVSFIRNLPMKSAQQYDILQRLQEKIAKLTRELGLNGGEKE